MSSPLSPSVPPPELASSDAFAWAERRDQVSVECIFEHYCREAIAKFESGDGKCPAQRQIPLCSALIGENWRYASGLTDARRGLEANKATPTRFAAAPLTKLISRIALNETRSTPQRMGVALLASTLCLAHENRAKDPKEESLETTEWR